MIQAGDLYYPVEIAVGTKGRLVPPLGAWLIWEELPKPEGALHGLLSCRGKIALPNSLDQEVGLRLWCLDANGVCLVFLVVDTSFAAGRPYWVADVESNGAPFRG